MLKQICSIAIAGVVDLRVKHIVILQADVIYLGYKLIFLLGGDGSTGE